MAASSANTGTRVVIDTNVLVSALLFPAKTLTRLREQWQTSIITPIICKATAREFVDVLRYPKFRLTRHEQNNVLAAYLPFCEIHDVQPTPASRKTTPRCRDPDDQKYIELANASSVHYLITGDKDLLALATKVDFQILTPTAFLALAGNH